MLEEGNKRRVASEEVAALLPDVHVFCIGKAGEVYYACRIPVEALGRGAYLFSLHDRGLTWKFLGRYRMGFEFAYWEKYRYLGKKRG